MWITANTREAIQQTSTCFYKPLSKEPRTHGHDFLYCIIWQGLDLYSNLIQWGMVRKSTFIYYAHSKDDLQPCCDVHSYIRNQIPPTSYFPIPK